jgi:hypothetical protein
MYIHHVSKTMIRKQVYLTAELDARLRREATRQRRSEAEILREALATRLNIADPADLDASADALWDLVGVAASADTDLSQRVDEVLYGKPAARR